MSDLSVVVAATWSAEAAIRTVESVLASAAGEPVEIVVASPGWMVPVPLPGRARWISDDEGPGDVPRLRRIGADGGTGGVVAFLEDACVVGPDWFASLRASFVDPSLLAATGPVEPDPGGSAIDWAVYFAEYAPFAVASARMDRLAGINFACRRVVLDDSTSIRETALVERIGGPGCRSDLDRREGQDARSRMVPGLAVRHVRRYGRSEAVRDRFRFGRTYGRERWPARPGRLVKLGLLAAPAILGLQLVRLVAATARSPTLIVPLVRSASSTIALLTAWSVGESAGWAEAARRGTRPDGTAGRRVAATPAPLESTSAGYNPGPGPA